VWSLAGGIDQAGGAGLFASTIFTPSTVSEIDAGGSPSARIQFFATASRIAASMASRLSMPSFCRTLSTLAQVGGGRPPVT